MAYYIIVCSSPTVPITPTLQFPAISDCPSSSLQWVELPKTVELKMPQAHSSDLAVTFTLFFGIVIGIGFIAFFGGVVVKMIWFPTRRY